MSNIPAARALLRDLLPTLHGKAATTVAEALDLMTRASPVKPKAPARKRTITASEAADIRAYVACNPHAHLQDIAGLFDTNIGRVSEALHGHR